MTSFISESLEASNILLIVLMVALIAAMFIIPRFTNKKQADKVNELYTNLKKGDEVMTIGGIIGTIVEVVDKNTGKVVVIETGVGENKTTMSLDVKGIYQNMTYSAQIAAAQAEAAAKKAAEKEASKNGASLKPQAEVAETVVEETKVEVEESATEVEATKETK